MREYLIAHILEPLPKGSEFVSWPLHITIVPWFIGPDDDAIKAMRKVTAQTRPFTIATDGQEFFGPKRDKPVRIMRHETDLHQLHNDLLDSLAGYGLILNSTVHTDTGYRPHVADKQNHTLGEGEVLCIDRVELIEADKNQPRQNRTKYLVERAYLGIENG